MIGTEINGRGGVASVVQEYRNWGLFDRWPIIYVRSHVDASRAPKLFAFIAAFWRFSCLLVGRSLAMVHVHASSDASFWRKAVFSLVTIVARRPLVFHLHGGDFDGFYARRAGAIGRVLVRFIFRHSEVVIVLSSQWSDRVHCLAPNASVQIVYNSVAHVANEAPGKNPNALLFLGRLIRDKGFFDLLDALVEVKKTYPAVRLYCGGAITEVAVEAIRARGLQREVELLEWIEGNEKLRWLDHCGVFVLPSYFEGLPVSLLEAMAHSNAVIVTPVGGVTDVVTDGVEGLLVNPGDIPSLAKAISTVVGQPERAAQMRRAARQKIMGGFLHEQNIGHIEKIYGRLLSRAEPGSIDSV